MALQVALHGPELIYHFLGLSALPIISPHIHIQLSPRLFLFACFLFCFKNLIYNKESKYKPNKLVLI